MKCVILANGPPPEAGVDLPTYDLAIAADGGALLASRVGIYPDVIVGDLDSLPAAILSGFARQGVKILDYPEDKDETDLELALNYASASGATEVDLLGMIGGRWDMTYANLFLLASPKYSGLKFRVLAEGVTIYLVRGGEQLALYSRFGRQVSILPLACEEVRISARGLKWGLSADILPFGSPRGVSNIIINDLAEILVLSGAVLIFHSREDFPSIEEPNHENP